MKLIFEKPENGWLPIIFENEDFRLEFTSSKIPENPTDEFCKNLILSSQGLNTKTVFNIEPHNYIFNLDKDQKNYQFKIVFHSESIDRFGSTTINKKVVFKKVGDFEEIVLPLYRSLKKFTTLDYKVSDWKKIESSKIEKLDKIIAKQKAIRN